MKTQNTRSIAARQQVDSRKPARKRTVKVTKPLTSDMVVTAISALRDGSGSSAQSIKNYIKTTYGEGSQSIGPALKSAAMSGKIVLVVGKGAMCTYKLAQKGKSKNLRGKGAVKRIRKTTPTKPEANSATTASNKPAKDAKKVTKRVVKKKRSPGSKASSSKTSSVQRTPKTASRKQETQKQSKKAMKKSEKKETDSGDK